MPPGRRRMVYDSIFTSADLCDLSANARWLWLGLFVHASKEGLIRRNLDQFRAQIMLNLRCNRARIEHYLSIFEARSMIKPCTIDGVTYYHVTNFHRYQKLHDHGHPLELKGKERKGKELEENTPKSEHPEAVCSGESVAESKTDTKTPDEAADRLANRDRWNTLATQHGLATVRDWTVERQRRLRARLKDHPEFWSEIEKSIKHLGSFAREKGFVTADFVLSPGSLQKLLDGNYSERGSAAGSVSEKREMFWRDALDQHASLWNFTDAEKAEWLDANFKE